MIATFQPLTFVLVVVLCFFNHNESAFHNTDDTKLPGQPGSMIPIPEPEEPPPEDGRSVYDPDVFKQWQGITFTDQVPGEQDQELEAEEEGEGPVMPSYPWRGGGHDPLPLSDPEEKKRKDYNKDEQAMVGYIDCKKVRTAEDAEYFQWEEDEEGFEKETGEKTEDTEESEELKDSTETGESDESEDDEAEVTEDSDIDEECCVEICDDDICDSDDPETGGDSSTRDEILSFFGVRADFVPEAIKKDPVISLPFVQNTELRVFGRNLSHRPLINTNNPHKYKNRRKEMRRMIFSSRFLDVPKYQNSSQAVIKQRNPRTHMNGNYGRLGENIQSKTQFETKNKNKSKHSSVHRREYRRKRNKIKDSSHFGNSSYQNISKYLPNLSEFLLRPNILSVQSETPYFKHGEILQPLIDPPIRRPLKNNFLQQFRGVPTEEQSRFSVGEAAEVQTETDVAEKDDVTEGSGLKTSEGWETSGAVGELFGTPSTLTYDQCEQCLPCCAYFSHRESEAGSFQWQVEDECKPDDRGTQMRNGYTSASMQGLGRGLRRMSHLSRASKTRRARSHTHVLRMRCSATRQYMSSRSS